MELALDFRPPFARAVVDTTTAREGPPIDDLSRPVYCLLGMPVDGVDMLTAVRSLIRAANSQEPFLVSTPNVNFLIQSLDDRSFRDAVNLSDLVTVDGMPLVWLSRLLQIPVKQRVAGSDMLDVLASSVLPRGLKVFFFGGGDGVAEAASRAIDARDGSLKCAGAMYPGFGSLDELSADWVIDRINASGADFLVVALGAAKGQAWLLRNHAKITVPVRAHLGAAVNFQAGTLRRAPRPLRRLGLEWMWRIKEEPQLWRRYAHDALAFTKILFTRALPIAVLARTADPSQPLTIKTSHTSAATTLEVSGSAVASQLDVALPALRSALSLAKGHLRLDVSKMSAMDLRFLGMLMMAAKQLQRNGRRLQIFGASRRLGLLFELNGLAHFLVQAESV